MPHPRFTQGWVYNLKGIPDSTEASRVIALALTFSALACLLVALRLGVRSRTSGAIGVSRPLVMMQDIWLTVTQYDDIAITISAVSFTA